VVTVSRVAGWFSLSSVGEGCGIIFHAVICSPRLQLQEIVHIHTKTAQEHVHGNLVTSLPLMTRQGSHALSAPSMASQPCAILLLTTHCSSYICVCNLPFLVSFLYIAAPSLRFHQRVVSVFEVINQVVSRRVCRRLLCLERSWRIVLGGDAPREYS